MQSLCCQHCITVTNSVTLLFSSKSGAVDPQSTAPLLEHAVSPCEIAALYSTPRKMLLCLVHTVRAVCLYPLSSVPLSPLRRLSRSTFDFRSNRDASGGPAYPLIKKFRLLFRMKPMLSVSHDSERRIGPFCKCRYGCIRSQIVFLTE